jgi:chorismate mutase-like protein
MECFLHLVFACSYPIIYAMNSNSQNEIARILKPHRESIDAIDTQIIGLLKERYSVIRTVGHIKAEAGIPAIIPERVIEVRENAARMARAGGLDEDFIRDLYTRLIDHSCATEEAIISRKGE